MPYRGFEGDLVLWTQIHSEGHLCLAETREKGKMVEVGVCNNNDVDEIMRKLLTAL